MVEISATLCHSNTIASCVWCAKWNRTGTILATCGEDKTIKLWKYIEEKSLWECSSKITGSHSRPVRYVDFSPDGQFLASVGFDSAVIIYQLYDGDYEEISRLEGHGSEVKCCAFSYDGQYLVTCSRDKSVWFWQLDEDDDFVASSILQPHTQDVKSIVWHPHDEFLVSCSYDCSIIFYRYDDEEWVTHQKIPNAHDTTVWCADFSADGNSLVSVGADGVVNLWQIEQLKAPLKKNLWSKCASVKVDTRWPLYTVSWNKNSGMIAVGGGDRRVRFFRSNDSDEKNLLKELDVNHRLPADVNCVSWKPSSNCFAAATDDGSVFLLKINL